MPTISRHFFRENLKNRNSYVGVPPQNRLGAASSIIDVGGNPTPGTPSTAPRPIYIHSGHVLGALPAGHRRGWTACSLFHRFLLNSWLVAGPSARTRTRRPHRVLKPPYTIVAHVCCLDSRHDGVDGRRSHFPCVAKSTQPPSAASSAARRASFEAAAPAAIMNAGRNYPDTDG